jgi:hypothetical protein
VFFANTSHMDSQEFDRGSKAVCMLLRCRPRCRDKRRAVLTRDLRHASRRTLGRVASSNSNGELGEDPQSVEKPTSHACLKSPDAACVLPFLLYIVGGALRGLRCTQSEVMPEVDVYAHVVGAIVAYPVRKAKPALPRSADRQIVHR